MKMVTWLTTLKKLKNLLEGVVQDGTAWRGADAICALAGKTGTCQLNYWKKETKEYQASFAGYFPANDPKYSCIVVVNKPQKENPPGHTLHSVADPRSCQFHPR